MYHRKSSVVEGNGVEGSGGARRGAPVAFAGPVAAAVMAVAVAGCAAPSAPFTPAAPAVRELPSVAPNPLPPLASFTTEANGTRVANVSADYLFALDSYDLLPESQAALAKILPTIRASTGAIRVIGFTDGTGTASANLDLSRRRAAAVRAWLISQGVPAARIAAGGKGSAGVKSGVADPSARRVEIVLG